MNSLQEYAPVKILMNNQGAITLSRNPVHQQRCKHIDIKYHFIADAQHNGSINIIHCPTADALAVTMTKPPNSSETKKKILRTFIRTLSKPTNVVLALSLSLSLSLSLIYIYIY